MQTFVSWLRGTERSAFGFLWGLGLLGVLLGLVIHTLPWSTIAVTSRPSIIRTGLQSGFPFALGLLSLYLVLLLLRSIYTLVPALLFVLYALEEVFGLHLLRYMPFSSTRLHPALYLGLPLTALLLLSGSFAPFLRLQANASPTSDSSGNLR